ncbi:MAG: undecaprenyl-phosphate glucose phosphotransferase [Alphaproteobacteria bacterium]|nr:undecaprenyl-phosphate glucose phosphotransferase [Alphaproteobacteria bacterium]
MFGKKDPSLDGASASADHTRKARRAHASRPVSLRVTPAIVAACDLGVVFGAGLFSLYWLLRHIEVDAQLFRILAVVGTILFVNLLQVLGGYRFANLAHAQLALAQAFAAWLAAIGALFVALRVSGLNSGTTHIWLLLWLMVGSAGLAAVRMVFSGRVRAWQRTGRLRRRTAVVGVGRLAERFLGHCAAASDPEVDIVGVYRDRREPHAVAHCAGHAVLGDIDDLIGDVRNGRIDMVIVAMPAAADLRLADTMSKLRLVPVDVRLCSESFVFDVGPCQVSQINGLTMFNVIDRPVSEWKWIAKAIEDRVLAAVILLLISPLLAAIAIAIKLDSPGPVFFRQKRYGFNRELIEVLKFRTMYHHARDPNAEKLTTRDDPRVTRVGAILRRTTLDELPQFFNVLRGEMSIVGPRPHAISAKAGGVLYHDAVRYYDARHRMKPGITGWAQINGWRGETQTIEQIQRRVEYDLYYIEHWSILLDLKIILRTIMVGFTDARAY